MRQPSAGIALEGLPFILFPAVSALVFAGLRWWLPALICLAAAWFCGYFFRDPERIVPVEADVAVSPADGKVVGVENRPDPMTGAQLTRISIFMSVFSVHVNRFPLSGTVERIHAYPGRFFNACLDKSSDEIERCALAIRDADGHAWTMVQIAGLIARRIVCRADPGAALARGERYGLIRFGSRVDLYLPDAYTPQVCVGDAVVAGESILARKRPA
jgi:phosphatidylserine decarboxylase